MNGREVVLLCDDECLRGRIIGFPAIAYRSPVAPAKTECLTSWKKKHRHICQSMFGRIKGQWKPYGLNDVPLRKADAPEIGSIPLQFFIDQKNRMKMIKCTGSEEEDTAEDVCFSQTLPFADTPISKSKCVWDSNVLSGFDTVELDD
nr:hypothetical protein Iba_chr10dCG12220 [Ipomoea batatas]